MQEKFLKDYFISSVLIKYKPSEKKAINFDCRISKKKKKKNSKQIFYYLWVTKNHLKILISSKNRGKKSAIAKSNQCITTDLDMLSPIQLFEYFYTK